jgi:hypothetical protein
MTRPWLILAALIPAQFAASAEPEPEPAPRPAARWQYAELRQQQSAVVIAPDGTRTQGKPAFSWSTSSAKVSADGWDEMAKKLKAPAAKDPEANHRLRVMDALGAQGWELVSVEPPAAAARAAAGVRGGTMWLFKRRLEK